MAALLGRISMNDCIPKESDIEVRENLRPDPIKSSRSASENTGVSQPTAQQIARSMAPINVLRSVSLRSAPRDSSTSSPATTRPRQAPTECTTYSCSSLTEPNGLSRNSVTEWPESAVARTIIMPFSRSTLWLSLIAGSIPSAVCVTKVPVMSLTTTRSCGLIMLSSLARSVQPFGVGALRVFFSANIIDLCSLKMWVAKNGCNTVGYATR